MSGSMVDIQSPTAEVRRGKKIARKKERRYRNHRAKISWSALLHMSTINSKYFVATTDKVSLSLSVYDARVH